MAFLVHVVPLNLTVDLDRLDLGHPNLPHLPEYFLNRTWGRGDLSCVDDANCPVDMYLRKGPSKTDRVACHYPRTDYVESKQEGEDHKILKERAARVAERAGFSVEVEARAASGRRRTDVVIHGEGGRHLGYEVQLSRISTGTIRRRSTLATGDGLTPFWTTYNREVRPERYSPHARIDQLAVDKLMNAPLRVGGGVRRLDVKECGWWDGICLHRKRGVPCTGFEARTRPVALDLDQLIVEAAGREWEPVFWPTSQGGYWYWMGNDDARVLAEQAAEEAEAVDAELADEEAAAKDRESKEPDWTCHYGENTFVPPSPRPVGVPAAVPLRGPVEPAADRREVVTIAPATVPQVIAPAVPVAKPAVVEAWAQHERWSDARRCARCGQPLMTAGSKARGVCARPGCLATMTKEH